jgi:UDP-N-acetylmuramoyl-L-alanyl-D-glutamate--2,6-diaminopimelate ligase
LLLKVAIGNADDPSAANFLNVPADEVWTFGTKPDSEDAPWKKENSRGGHVYLEEIKLSAEGSEFVVSGVKFKINLIGKTNVMNAGAAIALGRSLGIPLPTIASALGAVYGVPGRFEKIEEGQDYAVIVDYAHEPESFKQLYEAVEILPHERVIHVFGGTGGGRDSSRRPIMGTIAGAKADIVIVTMDDPYDEDPSAISGHVIEGARAAGKVLGKDLFDIPDRREAIRAAVRMALPNDLILITGKGSEQKMMLAHGKRVSWDDREAARAAIHTRGQKVQVYGRD